MSEPLPPDTTTIATDLVHVLLDTLRLALVALQTVPLPTKQQALTLQCLRQAHQELHLALLHQYEVVTKQPPPAP